MPNSNYIRGRKFEYDTMKQSILDGASKVYRMAGSHGDYDLIAFYPQEQVVLLTQCKTKITYSKQFKGAILESERKDQGKGWSVIGRKLTKYIRRTK